MNGRTHPCFDRPARGMFCVSQEPMLELRESMRAKVEG